MDEKSTFVIFKLEPLADLFCLSALHMRIISAYISWFIEEGGNISVNLSFYVLLLIQRLWTNSFSTIFLNRIQQIIHRLFKFFYKRTVRLKRLDKDPQEAYFRQKKKEDQFSDLLEVDQLFLLNGRRQIAADGPLHRNFGVKEKRLLWKKLRK